jgi:8-oxo-dGTP pyrophosphatase MutT (NUDIX family)
MIEIPQGVHRVHECLIRCGAASWPFASREESAIRRHWARRSAGNPKFFNGGVYIMTAGALLQGYLEGSLAATDFAASLYWRETGYQDRTVVDCFGSAILLGSDGALIYGRQTAGNINAGMVYPPGGFIDRRDVGNSGAVDLEGSVAREVREETGLDPDALSRDAGYLVTRDGPLLSIGVIYRLTVPAEEFCAQANGRLANEALPELEALVMLGRAADTTAHAMPSYARRIAMALLPH